MNAAPSHVTTSRAITVARVSVTAPTWEFAGARCTPSGRPANQVSKVVINSYFLILDSAECLKHYTRKLTVDGDNRIEETRKQYI